MSAASDVHDNWHAPPPSAARARRLRTREPRPQRDPDELRDRQFASGWESLTPRQQQVMRARCAGQSRAAIAEQLSMEEATVRSHLTQARRRLGLDGSGYPMIARTAYLLGRYDEANRWRRALEDQRCEGRGR